MSRRKAIHRHYEPRIAPGRENFDVLDWGDAESQQRRFQVLVDHVPLAGKTLLDVGCGLGDLWGYLKQLSVPVQYTGVDLIERMIAAAREQHADAEFICADLFADDAPEIGPFDVAFCSGAMNLDLGNNLEFLPRAMRRMLDLASETVVVNLLHVRTPDKYDHCAYYDPADMLTGLADLPCEARIVDDYLPNDFTVICRKTPG